MKFVPLIVPTNFNKKSVKKLYIYIYIKETNKSNKDPNFHKTKIF